MRHLATIFFTLVATIIDVVIAAIAVMFNSFYIHEHWWDVVPAFGFTDSLLIGVFLGVFSSLCFTASENTWTMYVGSVILSIVALPFIVPFVVGMVNDSLLPSMPDISIGTVFIMGLFGLVIGLVKTLSSSFLSGVLDTDDI